MVTTNSLIPVDAFASDANGLIHLTGRLQVVGRVTLADADAVPAHVELLFDAAQVRGVGVETGARYQARGASRSINDPKELPISLELVSPFEILAYRPGDPEPTHLLLVMPFRVTVRCDGTLTIGTGEPKLMPCP